MIYPMVPFPMTLNAP